MMLLSAFSRPPFNDKEVELWKQMQLMAPERPWRAIAEFNMSMYANHSPVYEYFQNKLTCLI